MIASHVNGSMRLSDLTQRSAQPARLKLARLDPQLARGSGSSSAISLREARNPPGDSRRSAGSSAHPSDARVKLSANADKEAL